MAHYLDTSALVKLVVSEAETGALMAWIKQSDGANVSSDLARTELLRAVRRSAPERMTLARSVLDGLHLLQMTTATLDDAGRLDPSIMRSLDALHLASALRLGDDLEGLVTYDERLAEAASFNGVPVVAPV